MKIIDPAALEGMTLDEIEETLAALVEHKRTNLLDFWTPYPRQREFIKLGATTSERLLLAGNQLGKSDTGAYETACHATGLYPKDWEGRRFDHPTKSWAAGESTTVGRDVAQTKLCGEPGRESALGTGFIPKACFADKPTLARGAVADAYDTIQVYHHNKDGVRDGISTIQFKSYEQGRKKFQGRTLDFIWWDEEPAQDIYIEGNARWSATGGMSFMTFTPLEGLSTVVLHFLESTEERCAFLKFRVDECPHMTPEKIADIKAKYPPHTWEARLNGEPFMGSGRVFRTETSLIQFPVRQTVPAYWALLWGIDFGINHPFAAVLGAWDRDSDILYLLATYKASDMLPIVHAEAIRRIGAAVPVAWPHDGHQRDKGSGEALSKQYKDLGLKMLPSHARYPDGNYSPEAVVQEMQQRLADGRLRVREDLEDWFNEYRMYHRKDGKLVQIRDDLLSATMKIVMMRRHARPVPLGYQRRFDPNMRPERSGMCEGVDFDLFA